MNSKTALAAVFSLVALSASPAFAAKVYGYACNFSRFEKRINFVFDPLTQVGFYQGLGAVGPAPALRGKQETEYRVLWYWPHNGTTQTATLSFENSILRGEDSGLVRENIVMPLRGYCDRMGELDMNLSDEVARRASLPLEHPDRTYLDMSQKSAK